MGETATKAWTRGEDAAERQLETLTERRAELHGNPDWHAQVWDESLAAYTQAAEQQRREQWRRHHVRMAASLMQMAEEHQQEAARLAAGGR